MAEVCSTDKLEVHYCELEGMTKFQSCQEKGLHMRNYDVYVREWENDYHT
jgi:hypothetical protein